MSASPDRLPDTGIFHQITGVPLMTFFRMNGPAYSKLDRELTLLQTNKVEQLKLEGTLENQHRTLVQAEVILKASVAQNVDDVASAKNLQRQAEQVREKVEFDSPFSTTPRAPTPKRVAELVVGRIPVIRSMYTSYQIADYMQKRTEAERVLDIETDAVASIEQFGKDVQRQLDLNQTRTLEATRNLEAQRKVVQGLHRIENDKKAKLATL